LLSGPALVVVFHLSGYLRARDLLPEYPILGVMVALGAVGVVLPDPPAAQRAGGAIRGLALAARLWR
jgi:hypothetical protein